MHESNQRLEDLRLGLAAKIPVPPDRHRLANELLALDLNAVLWAWMNWAYRSIPRRSRRVIRASAFNCDAIPELYRDRVGAVVAMIELGHDLTPYLSRKIATHGYVGPTTKNGSLATAPQWADADGDKDLALNAYGLHHLHLGIHQQGNAFCTPTDELLFVAFSRHDAALVHFGNHRSFNDGSLARAAASWKHEQGIHFGNYVRAAVVRDEHGIQRMERRGISTMRATADVLVPIIHSITGHSYTASAHADDCHDTIDELEARMNTTEGIRAVFSDLGIPSPLDPMNIIWGMQHCDLTLGNSEVDAGRTILAGPH